MVVHPAQVRTGEILLHRLTRVLLLCEAWCGVRRGSKQCITVVLKVCSETVSVEKSDIVRLCLFEYAAEWKA